MDMWEERDSIMKSLVIRENDDQAWLTYHPHLDNRRTEFPIVEVEKVAVKCLPFWEIPDDDDGLVEAAKAAQAHGKTYVKVSRAGFGPRLLVDETVATSRPIWEGRAWDPAPEGPGPAQ